MKFRLSPIAAAMLAAHALPAAAQSATAAPAAEEPAKEQATQLREVKVEADIPSGYKADTVQSPKFTQPLRDTPQTIQVITSELFTQQGATTLTEFRKRMGAIVGMDEHHGSFRQINFLDYLHGIGNEDRKSGAKTPAAKIALVVVQGEIVDGEGEPGYAGGETISNLLDDARRDKDVKAVLLRVDSPGGSVWASEQIRRAVRNLKEAGKPVVASMSSVAASGGYWVSMDADEIWAHPSTITGSIGIFGILPTIGASE